MKKSKAVLVSFVWFFINLILCLFLVKFIISPELLIGTAFSKLLILFFGLIYFVTSTVIITLFAKSLANYVNIHEAISIDKEEWVDV